MKRELRKSISIILVLLMIISVISACSKKNGDNGVVNNISMGRYVEEELTLPVKYANYNIISMLINKDGNLEVYCDQNTYDGKVKNGKLIYKNETWEESKIPWAAEIYSSNYGQIEEVILGEDGNYYALATHFDTQGFTSIIYRIVEDKAEPILIPALDVVKEISEGYSAKPSITAIGVRSDGSIVAVNKFVLGLSLYSQETGEVLKELDVVSPFLVTGDSVIGASLSGGLVTYKGDIEESIEAEIQSDNTAFVFDKETYYIADASGIRRLESGGSIWQTVVDGALTSMALPSYAIDNFIVTQDDNEEYYVKFDTKEDSHICYYYFDETIAASPESEITIYSLVENSSIREAISLFQKKRDVKINYNVAMSDKSGVTINDTIRALNTELLNGSGADIIILDGLPMDSYIEKGVLEDLSDFIQSATDEGLILSNIAKSYERDGKNYAFPARIQIPLFYGKEEILKHLGSTAEIVSYINANSGKQIFYHMTYQELAETLLLTYYNQLFDENGEVSKETFIQFLEDLRVIGVNIGSKETRNEENDVPMEGQTILDHVRLLQDVSFLEGTIEAGIMQLRTTTDLAYTYNSIKKCNLSYTDINDYFISGLTIGVNSASKNKELVTEFIRELLSEEVQNLVFGDGFPVNEKAFDSWVAKRHAEDRFGFNIDDAIMIDTFYPTAQEAAGVYAYGKTLSTPLNYNKLLIDAIVTNITEYLIGNVTAEQAAQDTINLINTYLSE